MRSLRQAQKAEEDNRYCTWLPHTKFTGFPPFNKNVQRRTECPRAGYIVTRTEQSDHHIFNVIDEIVPRAGRFETFNNKLGKDTAPKQSTSTGFVGRADASISLSLEHCGFGLVFPFRLQEKRFKGLRKRSPGVAIRENETSHLGATRRIDPRLITARESLETMDQGGARFYLITTLRQFPGTAAFDKGRFG